MPEPPSKKARGDIEFFSAWFCPYAQRAWIALEHHGLQYNKVEGLLPDKAGTDFVGYVKNPRLLELNPKGLVPTLSEGPGTTPVFESLIAVEYVDEKAKEGTTDATLLPGTPAARAGLRLKADWVNKNCCSPFYQVLVRKEQAEREAGLKALLAGLDELESWLQNSPFLAGDSLSIVDLAFVPWAHRIFVCKIFERFRGPSFAIDLGARPKLAAWIERVMALPSVKATLAEPDALSDTYKRYSDGTAASQVAEAVRQGKTADTI